MQVHTKPIFSCKKRLLVLSLSVMGLGLAGIAAAATPEFHKPPNDYLFGNHIDTHQETKLTLNKDGTVMELKGSLYIIFTGDVDAASGLPIARHPRGAGQGEACGVDPIECVIGWDLRGLPAQAKFLFHAGVNGDDHGMWLINRADATPPPAGEDDVSGVPQPGSYTHFHWISSDIGATPSNDPRAGDVPAVCDQEDAGQLESAGAANTVCPGWLLEIKAAQTFAFEHGGELVPVTSGIDNATHLNILTNYAVVPTITSTR